MSLEGANGLQRRAEAAAETYGAIVDEHVRGWLPIGDLRHVLKQPVLAQPSPGIRCEPGGKDNDTEPG